ncbi:hypothetical protein [Thermodesulfovibrio sp. Kuro-1]|uniref:hypothetical protein n=1 Tax=Thermodesulfovibrio sp. Kuro-1 TaxID=2580394 RepID=UPI001144FA7A|nr:hypothetical protein [Thermodesulfovibrio sp. Kuro-1]
MIQLLSIFNWLNMLGIFIFISIFSLISISLTVKSYDKFKFKKLSLIDLSSNFMKMNKFLIWLIISYSITLITIAATAWLNFPMADSYHWEMPYYWIKHETIKPFIVLNFRITSFSFLHEAQFVPFYTFFKKAELTFLVSAFCFILLPFVIREMAINIGFSREASIFAAFITTSFTIIIYSYYFGSNDISKSFWILVSIYFALEYINKNDKRLLLVIISVLSFCVALGIKNTTVILLPIYLAICILMIKCSPNKLKTFYIIFLSFIFGFLASTTVWLYLNNYLWYGDLRGFKENYLTAIGNLDYLSIKGRIVRGILYMVSDFGYLPKKLNLYY